MGDIESLTTYGFRGEALSSLCQVANLTIVSRTEAELAATRTVFREDGAMDTRTSCAGMPGITVTADNLFCRLPVRRNYYKSANRRKEELDKVKRLVQAFAIVCSDVRFSLHHDKCCVWSSPGGGQHMLDSVALVIGRRESNGLEKIVEYLDPVTGDLFDTETELEISGLLPVIRPGVETELARQGKNNTWIFINNRPVEFKEAEKILKESFMSVCGLESSKFPVCVINISIGGNMRDNVDPNLEPNKQKVGLTCKQVVIDGLSNILHKYWRIDKDIEESKEEKENMVLNSKSQADENYTISECTSDDDEPVVKEPLFNHIGFTQANSQATSKISADKFIENSYGLSQYFKSSIKPESTRGGEEIQFNSEDQSLEESYIDSSSGASKIQHSPILKPEMFNDSALPGVDAVYVNRLKSGDFPEIPEEELNDVSVREETSGQPRNPFIQFECQEEGQENRSPESEMDLLIVDKKNSRSEIFPSLKLKQPQFEKSFKSSPIKRKREDASLVKIDTFLSSHKRQNTTNVNCEKSKTSTSPTPTKFKRKKFLPRTRVSVTFNIDKCAAPVDDSIIPEKDMEVIGSLSSNTDSVWAVKRGQDLYAVHPPILREVILAERLMRHHKMPAQRLQEPLSLVDGILTPDLVKTVLQMSSEDNLITDERITLNGFLLSACEDRDFMVPRIQVLSSCNLIRDYGIDDLVEIISHVNENKDIRVREIRPTKVRQYLLKEAERLARDMPSTFDRESTAIQLDSWTELFGDKFKSKGFQKLSSVTENF